MAMWTHGHSVQIQSRGWDVRRTRNAGHIARTGEEGWCHFAIPTPTSQGWFDTVYLNFSTGDQATIDAIEVWDGDNRIFLREGLSLQGVGQKEVFESDESIDFEWGIGISVHVTFGLEAAGAWVRFFSAGAEIGGN